MAGVVLCNLNFLHDSTMLSVLLKHSEAKNVFVDYQFLDAAKGELEILLKERIKLPHLVLIHDRDRQRSIREHGDERFARKNQWPMVLQLQQHLLKRLFYDLIATKPTSRADSGRPKGVVYSHRGAYLNSLDIVLLNEMPSTPVYLWTVPIFHVNGWGLTWGVAA
ncbi:hypothetical protein RND71_032016 [Anisodus tanguticus]|uniref:AMP-dependent synthetase/ligase domain-containing protein n=1 Tax=Anisodus tanguticus TaxID=243964 RepID=A0AAE1RCE2_9SOLA|nr:hypothetical protein RND71_032016 [Anisodus tanguticus]